MANSDLTFMQRLAVTLKLPPDADAAAILAAIEAVMTKGAAPDPAKYAPVEAASQYGAELLLDRNTRIAAAQEAAASVKVEDAMRKGYFTPAMRDWATALCTQDPDSFDTFIAKSAPAYAHLTRPDLSNMRAAPRFGAMAEGRQDDSDAVAAVCAQLGLAPGSLND